MKQTRRKFLLGCSALALTGIDAGAKMPIFPGDVPNVGAWDAIFGLEPITRGWYDASFSAPSPSNACFDYRLYDGTQTVRGTGTIYFKNGSLDVQSILNLCNKLVITDASWANTSGGQITFTVSNTDAFVPGNPLNISGVSPPGYNGSYAVVSLTPTSIVVTQPTNPGLYASGGIITFADNFGNPLPLANSTFTSFYGMRVTRWYDQSGNGNHAVQSNLLGLPEVGVVNGVAHLGFDLNNADTTQYGAFLESPIAPHSVNHTVAAVCRGLWMSPNSRYSTLFHTSGHTDQNGISIYAPSIFGARDQHVTHWRHGNQTTMDDHPMIAYRNDRCTVTFSSGSAAIEFACNGDIFKSRQIYPSVVGNALTIGSSFHVNNSFTGWIDAIMFKASALGPVDTANVRAALKSAYNIDPDPTTNVVVAGDSGSIGFGGLLPLVPQSVMGCVGYGIFSSWFDSVPKKVRYASIGCAGECFGSSTGCGGFNAYVSSFLRYFYRADAGKNIFIVRINNEIGAASHDDFINQLNTMVSNIQAIAKQNWTIYVMDQNPSNPDFASINAAVRANSTGSNYTCIDGASLAAYNAALAQYPLAYLGSPPGIYAAHGGALAWYLYSQAEFPNMSQIL